MTSSIYDNKIYFYFYLPYFLCIYPLYNSSCRKFIAFEKWFLFFCFLFFILSCGEVHIHAFDPHNIIMIYSRHVFQLLIYGKIIFEPSILFPTGFLLKHVTLTCVIMIQYLFSKCKKYHNCL